MQENIAHKTRSLWHSGSQVKWRIAVGGDFFPTMELQETPAQLWDKRAEYLKPYFADIDCAIVNLECPIACEGLAEIPKLGSGSNIFGSKKSLKFLKKLKINLVGLANNHMMDFGPAGVLRTHEALLSSGIGFLGAPLRKNECPEVKIVDVGKARVGFWAAFLNAEKTRLESTGVEAGTTKRSRKSLAKMGKGISCRIALIHAGLENTHYPDPYELKLLHGFIEEGFDLVCVCHSHRISGYAQILRPNSSYPGFCFHGLGSILSGCIYGEPEREGLIVVLGLDEYGKPAELSIRPVWLDRPGWGMIPNLDKSQLILNRFEKVSAEIEDGSFQKEFYSDIGQDLSRRFFRDLNRAFKNRGLAGVAVKLSRIRPKHLNRLLNKFSN
jgi:hypothetical protein